MSEEGLHNDRIHKSKLLNRYPTMLTRAIQSSSTFTGTDLPSDMLNADFYRNRYGLKMASTAISVTSITGRVRRTQGE